MRQICSVSFSIVLALVVVLTLPVTGISQITTTKPLVKTFTAAMSYRIVHYRSMVVALGLWKRAGVTSVTVKWPSIERSLRGTGPKILYNNPPGGADTSTYNVTVKSYDVVRSDGSASASQTITTTCDDGTKYTDTMTYVSDGKGNTTETQTVTAEDPNGTRTTETTTNTSTGSSFSGRGGGGNDYCWGVMCSMSYYCCMFCKDPNSCRGGGSGDLF